MEEIFTQNYFIREKWGELTGQKFNEMPALTGVSRGWEFKGYQLVVNGGDCFTKGKIVAIFNDTDKDTIVAVNFTSTDKFNDFLKYHSEIEVVEYKSYFEFTGIKEVQNPNFTKIISDCNKEYQNSKFKGEL